MTQVAVVGGGIAGLAAAYELCKCAPSLELHLFEERDRVGGTILTERADGFVIEAGPDCLLAEKPWALELAREVGIGAKVVHARADTSGTYVLVGGSLRRLPEGFMLLAPTSLGPFLASDLLSLRGKLRVLLEPFIPPKRDEADESLADFVRRRLGEEVLERIAEPLVAGIHGGSPEVLSLKSTFPRIAELEARYGGLLRGMRAMARRRGKFPPFVSFREGMAELVKAVLQASEGVRLHLRCPVEAVRRTAGGFLICTPEGELEVEALILATPSYRTAGLLRPLAPELAQLLEGIPYVSSITVSLAFNEGDVRGLMGHGFVVPRKEGRRLMAVTYSSRKFPDRAPEGKVLIRAFLGGARDEGVLELQDRELLQLVLEELRGVLGLMAEPILWRLYRWPKAMAQYRVGHEGLVLQIEKGLEGTPGLFLAGGAYRGIGVGDCVRSGREAARRLLGFLGVRGGT